MTRAALRLQLTAEAPEAAITLDARHLILRPAPPPGHGAARRARQAARQPDPARLQLQRLDEIFDEAGD